GVPSVRQWSALVHRLFVRPVLALLPVLGTIEVNHVLSASIVIGLSEFGPVVRGVRALDHESATVGIADAERFDLAINLGRGIAAVALDRCLHREHQPPRVIGRSLALLPTHPRSPPTPP